MNLFLHTILVSVNANLSPVVTGGLIFHNAINKGKDGVILAHTHIITRMNAGAALANQNGPRPDILPGVSLYPEPLGLTIPTVTGTTTPLFMRHFQSPLFSYAAELF
jgi:hypothetical protein